MWFWLGADIQPLLYVVSQWPYISLPPSHFTGSFEGRTINTELRQRFFSTQCCCHTDLWMHSRSHLIISIIFNISPVQHPLRKSKLTLFVGLSLCPFFKRSHGCLKPFSNFHLSIFGHDSHGPASLLDYRENHITWADSSLVVPLQI